ncbi:MAG: hypothetical protein UT39_C0018G0058 [Candidatus Woesebacteria bacterium GW2011_GWA1_39_21]|uniref:Peptidase M50 domain-containing protein n=1 Tax=Candidatus Woesebacteria bacterium GW2011_GWA1_39_21 TaxID=1618550 RepID=A0A0G0QJL7_9BACT|nr:MAG: hypothetical protein UT39_C0018G0058 [Candidatus Woesebacteria bacterium GW2011_GWA1_39_21]
MQIISAILAFVIAITIHEASHAWMSDRLGDPTARLMGRLSFNPLRHLDLYGTVLIPLFLIFIGSPFVFGWAKPVMFDPYNLRNPKKDGALIALSGPASNMLLAIVLAVVFNLINNPFFPSTFLKMLLTDIITINVALAIFNLIPIHPLDGGKIFIGVLPDKDAAEAENFMNRFGLILLLIIIFPLFGRTSALNAFITPIVSLILKILIPGSGMV